MSRPERILVFETSALLATLSLFTDHYTYDPEALERLLEPVAPGQEPALDKVLIPDHVIYELTGILPISFPDMLRRFKVAKDDPKALAETIELYALASPRGEVNDPTDDQKSHVRMLLRFVANHPDCIVDTTTSHAYCKRLKADYSVLGVVNEAALLQYRPTFADAFHYLGDAFHADELRVHAGQLLMMGVISETSYNDRMSRIETALSKQQRFYKTEEFLAKMTESESTRNGNGKNGHGKSGYLPANLVEHIKRTEEETPGHAHDEHNGYLKLGLFRRHPQLLRLAQDRYYTPPPSGVEAPRLDDDALCRAAFGPSHLLMEHYIYSGILPDTSKALFIAAAALGFDVKDMRLDDDYGKIKGALYNQGFYEVSPTLAQLRLIQQACVEMQVTTPVLDAFIVAIPCAEHAATQRFREACQHPNAQGLAQQKELRMPYIGLAYEKVFGDALINGSLRWDEFQRLVQESGGLPRRFEPSYIGSQSGDVLLKVAEDPKRATVLIAQSGFVGRTGKTEPNVYVSRSTRTLPVGNEQRVYYELPAEDLIARCRKGLVDRRVSNKLYRSFETMLYRPTLQEASRLHDTAVRVLGEDRVVQLEKDFANRYARRSLQVQPPFANPFTALHTNSRILRKNLGEVATFEAAARVFGEHPDAHVWVANHDSDLFCNPQHSLQLEDAIVRQHAGLNPKVRELNDVLRGKATLHLVNTNQFLDSLHGLMGRAPRGRYEAVSAKPLILNHRSRSWTSLVDAPIAESHQR